ncbi:MAG: alcohol dehydrogenase catalytic domain-containing protein [Armatimonadota bacterium]|nr:alcohol dehydrogenase catalytic domain-containing protein [Armatimonadota bacterium]MDR7404096.1 alcohol dehydrogenase catalytic domain-containing protein [Armatimonadota bacterium]
MRALVFHPTIARFVLTRALCAIRRSAAWGPWAPLRYREVPEPRLPGEEWVRVRVRLGGICGSDLHTIHLDSSPALSAVTSFPFVLGHENVGTVAEVGRRVEGLAVGQRVTVEPALPCAARDLPPCPYCAAGRYNLCVRVADGHLSPGLMIGACRDTGGSWSAGFVAHRSQVFPVPDGLTDEDALMAEPAACAVHPLLASPPSDHDTVLVIGGGIIGQCAIAALRALGSAARIVALVKHAYQGEAARRLGADRVVRLAPGDAHYPEVADLVGGVLRRPMLGKRVLLGGADLTVECVGSARSLDDAFRLTRPGGTVVLLGLAAVPAGVDWTPVWWKELRVTGSYIYGVETWQGRRVRTLPLVLEWMAAGRMRLGHLVTHHFPLEEYRAALRAASGKARSRAFKVAFAPR